MRTLILVPGSFQALSKVNGLYFEIVLKTFNAAFSSDTGLLESAKRHLVVDDQSVDGNAARTHAASDLITAFRIFGVDRTVQSVHGAVGLGNGIVNIVVADEGNDGSEDFFLSDRHAHVDIREYRWFDEVAL